MTKWPKVADEPFSLYNPKGFNRPHFFCISHGYHSATVAIEICECSQQRRPDGHRRLVRLFVPGDNLCRPALLGAANATPYGAGRRLVDSCGACTFLEMGEPVLSFTQVANC
jgi:hypothetical protein